MFVQFFQVFAWKAKLCIATMRVIVGTFQALALQVVLAERSLREMQGQVRLHFRTQDPQGLAEAAYLGDLGRSNPHESPSLMADWMFNHLSMFSITNHEAHLISNWPVQRSITRSYARKHPTSLHDFAPLHPLHLSDFHAQPLGAYKRLHCVSYREGCKSHRIELMKVCWGNGLKVETGISMMEETWRNHEALFTLSYLARTCFLQYFLPLFTALSKSSHHWMDKVIQFHIWRPSQTSLAQGLKPLVARWARHVFSLSLVFFGWFPPVSETAGLRQRSRTHPHHVFCGDR